MPLRYTAHTNSEVAWIPVDADRSRLNGDAADKLIANSKLDLHFLAALPQLSVLSPTELGYLVSTFLPRVINPEEIITLVDSSGVPTDIVKGMRTGIDPYLVSFVLNLTLALSLMNDRPS